MTRSTAHRASLLAAARRASLLAAAALALLAFGGCASPARVPVAPVTPAPPPEPVVHQPTEEEALAYHLGVVIVDDLHHYYFDRDEQAYLLEGARDGLLGKGPADFDRRGLSLGLRDLAARRAQERVDSEKRAGEQFLTSLGQRSGAWVEDNGVVILDMREGDRAYPSEGEFIEMEVQAWLRDGKSIFDGREPSVVQHKYLLPCWKEVLPKVRIGGQVEFACPPELAYGDEGKVALVPPGAAIRFAIKLLDVVPNPSAVSEEEHFSEGAPEGSDEARSRSSGVPPASTD